MYVFAYMYACAPHAYLVSTKTRKDIGEPGSETVIGVTMVVSCRGVLTTLPRSFARATSALNYGEFSADANAIAKRGPCYSA